MTCIVAVVKDGVVWMGADSAGVSGYAITARRDPKIYKVGEMMFGFTSSFRMGQLLGYKFTPPEHPEDMPIERYMCTLFVDALRTTLKEGGYASINDGVETAGNFLVGYRGHIFNVNDDYQVGENIVQFDAVGCGADIAVGSLYSTDKLSPAKRLTVALEAAEMFSAGVRGPFLIDKVK
jgi:hypothetical protein